MPTAAPKSSGAYPGDSGRRLRLRVRPGPLDPETGDVRGVDLLAWAIRDDRHVTRIVARRDVQDLPEPDSTIQPSRSTRSGVNTAGCSPGVIARSTPPWSARARRPRYVMIGSGLPIAWLCTALERR